MRSRGFKLTNQTRHPHCVIPCVALHFALQAAEAESLRCASPCSVLRHVHSRTPSKSVITS